MQGNRQWNQKVLILVIEVKDERWIWLKIVDIPYLIFQLNHFVIQWIVIVLYHLGLFLRGWHIPNFHKGIRCTIWIGSWKIFALIDKTPDFDWNSAFWWRFAPSRIVLKFDWLTTSKIMNRKLKTGHSCLIYIFYFTDAIVWKQWYPFVFSIRVFIVLDIILKKANWLFSIHQQNNHFAKVIYRYIGYFYALLFKAFIKSVIIFSLTLWLWSLKCFASKNNFFVIDLISIGPDDTILLNSLCNLKLLFVAIVTPMLINV